MAGTNGRRVSLTMIARDEEANLPRCLDTVADLVDEVVVVDTGSTDRTRELARRYGASVVDFPWCDDFSAARNAALDHATGDWALWFDADDRLDAANRERLARLLAGLDDRPFGFLFRQQNTVAEAPGEVVVFDRVHLFPRRPGIRWERRVHEQILPGLERSGIPSVLTDVVFHHTGYSEPTLHRRKAERNLRLLELELRDRPDDGFTRFNLAWTLHLLGRLDEAMARWPEARRLAEPGVTYLAKLHTLWSRDAHALGRPDEALRICRLGREAVPGDSELMFLEALLHRERGDRDAAEALLNELIRAPAGPGLAAADNPGIRGHKARHNLAELCRERGRDAEAEVHWRSALAAAPGFAPAWRGLAELYVDHGHPGPAREAIDRLAALPGGADQAAALRSRLPTEPSSPTAPTPAPGPPPTIPDPPGAAEALAAADGALAAGRLDDAEAGYRALLDPGYLPGLIADRLGQLADLRGDFDAAWEHHRRAVAVDPGLAARLAPQNAPHRLAVLAREYPTEPVAACPVCGEADREVVRVVNCLAAESVPLAIDPVRRWVRCRSCGHGYADPRPSPGSLAEALAEPPPAHLVRWSYEQLTRAAAIVARLHTLRPGGAFLDVGAGGGLLSGAAVEYGYEAEALEVHPTFEPRVRAFGAEFLLGDLLSYDFGKRRYGVIAMGDVLEHLPDPRRALAIVADLLEPGGVLWISTPNIDGAWARSAGRRDPMWRVAEHLQYFSRASLNRLLAEHGFEPVDYRLSERYVGCGETTARRVAGAGVSDRGRPRRRR